MAKKALLVGCNYPGTEGELHGCINDVLRWYQCLIQRYGFTEEDIYVMVDTDSSFPQPTGVNIRTAFTVLCQSMVPGDSLFFHFSGHGIRLPAEPGTYDNTGYDECIVPCDMNLITDDDFRAFVDQVPQGCRITIISDSCHSGGLIDGAKEQIGESTKREELRLRDFLRDRATKSFEKRGIHLPLDKLSRRRRHNVSNEAQTQSDQRGGHVINRSLPLSVLIAILKKKTGKGDISEENLKHTLFDIFGEDASPKLKKGLKYVVNKLQTHLKGSSKGGRIASVVSNLALDFAKQKLELKEINAGTCVQGKGDPGKPGINPAARPVL